MSLSWPRDWSARQDHAPKRRRYLSSYTSILGDIQLVYLVTSILVIYAYDPG